MIHSIFNLDLDSPTPEDHKEIILGAGCFWGVERVFWKLILNFIRPKIIIGTEPSQELCIVARKKNIEVIGK